MSDAHVKKVDTNNYATQLNNKGIIQLKGEEQVKYLQGQVTADIELLSDDNALLACHCDFKGKVWSVFYALTWQDSILLVTHQSVLTQSLTELNKYGVFAKVDITEESQNWQLIGGRGPAFEASIIELFGKLPQGQQSIIYNDFGVVMSIQHPAQRYLVLQPTNCKSLLKIDVTDDETLWEIDDINAGLADIRDTTSNEYVPQMLNLQAVGAINFEKGCYMGQEVVARTKYLGRNKRASFILTTEAAFADLSGGSLEYQIGENWRPGGKILRSASTNNQTWIFAILPIDTEVSASFRLKSQPEITFITQTLPYTIQ